MFGSKNRVEENVIYGYTLHGNVAFESWIKLSTKNLGYFVMSNAYHEKFTNDVALEICCKMSMKYTTNIFDVHYKKNPRHFLIFRTQIISSIT